MQTRRDREEEKRKGVKRQAWCGLWPTGAVGQTETHSMPVLTWSWGCFAWLGVCQGLHPVPSAGQWQRDVLGSQHCCPGERSGGWQRGPGGSWRRKTEGIGYIQAARAATAAAATGPDREQGTRLHTWNDRHMRSLDSAICPGGSACLQSRILSKGVQPRGHAKPLPLLVFSAEPRVVALQDMQPLLSPTLGPAAQEQVQADRCPVCAHTQSQPLSMNPGPGLRFWLLQLPPPLSVLLMF